MYSTAIGELAGTLYPVWGYKSYVPKMALPSDEVTTLTHPTFSICLSRSIIELRTSPTRILAIIAVLFTGEMV